MKNSLFLSTMAIALTWVPAAEATPTTDGRNVRCSNSRPARCSKYDGAEMLATRAGIRRGIRSGGRVARKGCAAPSNDMQLLRGAWLKQLFKHDFGTVGARPKRELDRSVLVR